MVNVLYYISVVLHCVRYSGEGEELDRFMQGLKELLLRYAEKKKNKGKD
ncbi:MAG: hypothetical protein ACI4OZ_05990 [Akkermansia sp.]